MPSIAVVGAVNLDLVATVARLPDPGETVTNANFVRHPGGKGANQALAAKRLGADVALTGKVGVDAFGEEALRLLVAGDVDLTSLRTDPNRPTGVALIIVADNGENQIVVAPGANAALTPEDVGVGGREAVLCQLEIPIEVVAEAATQATGLFCVNAAPAKKLPGPVLERADLIVVNQTEWRTLGPALNGSGGLVALTLGAEGAHLYRKGSEIAAAVPPPVAVVDTVGAGDAFCSALVVSLLEDRTPAESLRRACAAGALATTRPGAQPSLPTKDEVDAVL